MNWMRRARNRCSIALATLLVGAAVWLAPPSGALIFVVPAPGWVPTSTVGQTYGASLGIGNFSTPPQSTSNPVLTISAIDLYPACTSGAVDCSGGTAEAGVFAVSATGTGSSTPAGNASCEVGTWTIVPDTGNPLTATRYRFVPPGGEGTLLLPTGEVCVVSFTATTLRVPTFDVDPAPGVQTFPVASSTAMGPRSPACATAAATSPPSPRPCRA